MLYDRAIYNTSMCFDPLIIGDNKNDSDPILVNILITKYLLNFTYIYKLVL